jgi:hypothetical protein
LNIEQFHNFFFQNQNKNVREIGASSWYCWKALDEWDFLGGDFINFRLKVGEILNF